ncbi:hypothetical protein [Microbacterium sp. P05]|uniref:hypothetical protein n=1 Tax=Microbacterium sp. P05 TaxID=3366948 RepID=UPI0037468956
MRIAPSRQTPLYQALSRWMLRAEARSRARGSRRVRAVVRSIWVAVALVGVFLLFGPVINAPITLEDITSAAEDVDERWIAASFDAAHTVERSADGRLVLRVEETIEAVFPDEVDEQGIERTIASLYEGHDLHPADVSAEVDGQPITVDVSNSPTRTTFALDTGAELDGRHTFVLRYALRDVASSVLDESTGQRRDVLRWDIFGPAWAQGLGGSSLTLTLPTELDAELLQPPFAAVAWAIVGDSERLTPDSETASTVTYVVDNDQRLPPHAEFWFSLDFRDGTFTMPPPSPLYWVLVVGPFLPLLLLGVTLVFSLAARAVAWSDARGRAWFVAQSEPDPDISADLAARLSRSVLTAPLVSAVARYAAAPSDATARAALGRSAARAGRWGDLANAWRVYLGGPAWAEQFRRGLRRVPRGVVRDTFIGASLALTVVQWGLVRQLSHQISLSEYWWPWAIVALSAVAGVVVLTIALTARPLTRPGAFAAERLRGVRLFLEQTSAAGRITLRDPLLPYVAMFTPPRAAGETITDLLRQDGHAEVSAGQGFLTAPRLIVRAVAVASLLAMLVVAFTLPSPSERSPEEDVSYSGDLPGGRGWVVSDADLDAHLSRGQDGRAHIEATETLQVLVDGDRLEMPQLMRQYRDRVNGNDLGLAIVSVRLDGEDAPYELRREQGMAFLQTRFLDPWAGEHEIEIRYELADAATAVETADGWRDQVQWTGLNEGWESAWSWQEEGAIERVAAQVSVDAVLDASIEDDASGWLTWYRSSRATDLTPLTGGVAADDEVVRSWELEVEDDGYWSSDANRDVGVRLTFPAGTFDETDRGAWYRAEIARAAPVAVSLVLSALSLVFGAWPLLARSDERRRRFQQGGMRRDLVRWIPGWFAASALVSFVWVTADAVPEDPVLPLVGLPAVAACVVGVISLVRTRQKALVVVPAPRTKSGRPSSSRRKKRGRLRRK